MKGEGLRIFMLVIVSALSVLVTFCNALPSSKFPIQYQEQSNIHHLERRDVDKVEGLDSESQEIQSAQKDPVPIIKRREMEENNGNADVDERHRRETADKSSLPTDNEMKKEGEGLAHSNAEADDLRYRRVVKADDVDGDRQHREVAGKSTLAGYNAEAEALQLRPRRGEADDYSSNVEGRFADASAFDLRQRRSVNDLRKRRAVNADDDDDDDDRIRRQVSHNSFLGDYSADDADAFQLRQRRYDADVYRSNEEEPYADDSAFQLRQRRSAIILRKRRAINAAADDDDDDDDRLRRQVPDSSAFADYSADDDAYQPRQRRYNADAYRADEEEPFADDSASQPRQRRSVNVFRQRRAVNADENNDDDDRLRRQVSDNSALADYNANDEAYLRQRRGENDDDDDDDVTDRRRREAVSYIRNFETLENDLP